MNFQYSKLFIFVFICGQGGTFEINKANNSSDEEIHQKSEILSRRKRFLVFPEGSSVQLVFCNTFPSINVIDDIILFGYTAALAYELPQDPYSPFDHHADPLHRRHDTKEIFYLNEDGRIINRQQYHRKFIVNPAFAKRSVDGAEAEIGAKKEDEFKMNRELMHASRTRDFLKGSSMEQRHVEFHRTSRALLYSKIETMIQGLGGNGRECLLKTLCLVGQTQEHPQGTFYQEILRAVFTLPKGSNKDAEHVEYDVSHSPTESCDDLFPECNDPLRDPQNSVFLQ